MITELTARIVSLGTGLIHDRKIRIPFLLTISVLPRLLWAFYLAPYPFLVPDELLYPKQGRQYIEAFRNHNLSAFGEAAAQPPLSKLITGLLANILSLNNMLATRLQCVIFSSLTCLLLAEASGPQLGKRKSLIAGVLVSLDPLSITYGLAQLDSTALFFMLAAFFSFIGGKGCLANVRTGVLTGLACLCKIPSFPIMIFSFFLTYVHRHGFARSLLLKLGTIMMASMLVVLAGYPSLWPSTISGFDGPKLLVEDLFRGSAEFATVFDWLQVAIVSPNQRVFALSTFLSMVLTFPFEISRASTIPLLLVASLLWSSVKPMRGSSDMAWASGMWTCSSTLFFWLFSKFRLTTYSSIMLVPPMTLWILGNIQER